MSNQTLANIDETFRIAKAMAISGLFVGQTPEQAFVKIMAGREFGIGPFAAMTGISIIKGKPVLGANLLASQIKNDTRYNYKVTKHSDTECEITFYENGEVCGISAFTMKDAQKAGLAGRDNWQNYPRNMLFARALSNGAKWYCPGAFGGSPTYTPDEFGLDVDEEGDIIEGKLAPPAPPIMPVIEADAGQFPEEEEGEEPEQVEPEQPKPQTWKGKWVQSLINDYGYKDSYHAVGALNQSFILKANMSFEKFEVWAKARQKAKEAGREDTTNRADNALADYLVA